MTDAVAEGSPLENKLSEADAAVSGSGHARRFLWQFLPEASIVRHLGFQRFMLSTFLSDGAREAVRYGALVAIVASGGSAFRSALLGAIALVPPTLLGMVGGAIADALPRRIALVVIYTLQAASCLVVPLVLGTGFLEVALLIFLINPYWGRCRDPRSSR